MDKVLRIFILTLIFVFSAYAQGEVLFNPVADSLFKSGVELFKQGLNLHNLYGDTFGFSYFQSAYQNFISVISFGLNHRTSASYLMASKSLSYLGRFSEAEKFLSDFLVRFPESEYIEDAYYTLGLVCVKLRNFKDAILNFDKAISRTKTEKSKYLKIVGAVVDSLKNFEFTELENESLSSDVRFILVSEFADRIASHGRFEDAKRYVANNLFYFKGTEFYEKLMLKISYFDRLLVRPKLKIGVLLPEKESLSESILKGMEIAIDQHNLNSNPKVGIEVRYYRSENVDQKLLNFKNYPEVVGIVGPVYSQDIELCSRFVNEVGVPVISPTAMSDGLTRLSDYFFQFNSDFSTRARALAQFAIFTLDLKYFVVLAPNDKMIKPFVDSFVDEVKKNSADVVAIQFYNPDETDLRPYFRNLISKFDSLKIPTDEISNGKIGLFAPILNSDYIGIISSQVYYHDLKVKILGNDVWNNYAELYMNRRYTDGVIFTGGQYVDFESLTFKNFASLFRERFGVDPDEFAVYGYDSANLILKIIEEGKLTGEEIYRALKNFETTGVGRDVVFNENRVNSAVSILIFKDNLIRRITQWVIGR